jgi:hypothetical protein
MVKSSHGPEWVVRAALSLYPQKTRKSHFFNHKTNFLSNKHYDNMPKCLFKKLYAYNVIQHLIYVCVWERERERERSCVLVDVNIFCDIFFFFFVQSKNGVRWEQILWKEVLKRDS